MQLRSRQMVVAATLALGLVVALAGSARAQVNSSLGTWKLNIAKSHFDPGPPPKSDDRVYEAWEGNGVKVTTTRVEADGTRTQATYSAHYDGKDYKYSGVASRDAIALTRIDANTVDSVVKKGGTVIQTNRSVISAGGKVWTLTSSPGVGLNGQKTNKSVMVFDKQ